MNSVLISSESRYPINRKKIKETVFSYLEKIGLEDAELSIAVVGSRKIKELNRKWRNLNEPTTVLTFALEEPRDEKGVLRIGDIVICYPQARLIAQEDNLSMDEAVDKLLVHGLNNLLGNYRNDSNFLSQTPAADISGT
ncbi:rRNA maturation RNase YbeY [Candidatus Microgenomates bacterium]|jgi:probable rRNA maturation factor|nr:MAG: rRNA maturation RNase YbeY [Candidatus Microgenomates bacterium]